MDGNLFFRRVSRLLMKVFFFPFFFLRFKQKRYLYVNKLIRYRTRDKHKTRNCVTKVFHLNREKCAYQHVSLWQAVNIKVLQLFQLEYFFTSSFFFFFLSFGSFVFILFMSFFFLAEPMLAWANVEFKNEREKKEPKDRTASTIRAMYCLHSFR